MVGPLTHWRLIVSDILSEEIGVLGEIAIDETLEQLNLGEDQMRLDKVIKFLTQLARNLPSDIDRKKIVLEIRDRLYSEYR